MERVIAASVRALACALTLATLAACNGESDSSSNTNTPSASEQPHTPTQGGTPTEPTTPSAPSDTSSDDPSDTPSLPSEPSEPTEPTEPVEPPTAANVAPQIAGSPANEVVVGQAFNFQPSATDADGDDLSFSIQGKPSWASFNSATGRLWGTPGSADVGSHEQIVISVSDGESTRALPEFAVTVVEQTNGSAMLAWQPPTENTDGSALTNLKGYKIHYGTTSGIYTQSVTVNNAGVTSYVIENLAPGTYFFAISALTTTDVESEKSAEASKTI